MKYAISTHSGLWLADEGGHCEPLAFGYYYGLAFLDDRLIAARRLHARTKDSPTIVEAYETDSWLQAATPEIDGSQITDIHQIAVDDDGTLWLTDGQHERLWRWTPTSGLNYLQFAGGSLLNSVQPAADGRLWLVFHNRGRRPSVAFEIDPSAEEHFQPIDLTFSGVHNVLPLADGSLCFNASDDGAVCRRDPDGGIHTLDLGNEWHPKGMARLDEDHLVVGVSEREVDLDGRFTSRSWLGTVDIDSWTLEESTPLRTPGGSTIGNINEVRVL